MMWLGPFASVGRYSRFRRPVPPGRQDIGFLSAVGALVSWTAYAAGNSRWLARLDGISGHDWNLLMGVAT